jgi:hypothetical protein
MAYISIATAIRLPRLELFGKEDDEFQTLDLRK